MSVTAAMQPRLDQAITMPQRVASDDETPTTGDVGWLDAAIANVRLAMDDDEAVSFNNRDKAYYDLENALVGKGQKRSRYNKPEWSSYWGVDYEKKYASLWQDVEEARRSDPRAFADIPKSQQEFDTWAFSRRGERARDKAVAAKGGFGSQIIPTLAYGLSQAGSPENLPQMLLGAGTKTAAEFVIAQFYAGMLGAALQTPATVKARVNMGEGYTPGELATDMLIGGAANTAFAGAIVYGPKAGARIYEKVVPFDYRAAQALKRATPDHLMPPDVAAAWNVLTRHEDLAEANPYQPSYAGVDGHFAKLREVTDAMVAGDKLDIASAATPAATPAVANAPSAGMPAQNLGSSIDAYMAAARRQESAGNDAARNPQAGQTASGRYGFTNGTWLAYYRKTYPNTGLDDAAIIARKGQGDVQDRVMRTFTQENAGWLARNGQDATPGNLYVVHHMGTGGAGKVFGAAPDTPMKALFDAEVIGANPHLAEMTAGQFRRFADRKMGGTGAVVDGPVADIDVPPVRSPDLDAARPVVEMPDIVPTALGDDLADVPVIRPDVMNEGLLVAMRSVIDDRTLSLNDMPALARELGTDVESLLPILQRLVAERRLTLTKSGIYRRKIAQGPEDALTFIARSGGLAYDGLSRLDRNTGISSGHDLKNTGYLNTFVPQSGPLLRPTGRGLEEVGESLWDAGYFGPPETAARPTEGELITWLNDAIRKKEKRFSFADVAPEGPKPKASDFEAPKVDDADVAADAARARSWQRNDAWNDAARAVGAAPMLKAEVAKLEALLADGTDLLPPWREADLPPTEDLAPYVLEMVNREIDDVLEAAHFEIEDSFYDPFTETSSREASSAAQGGDRPAIDAGDARAGGASGGTGPKPAELDAIDAAGLGPARFDEAAHTAFDDPAGDGIAKLADSAWHDVRANVDPNIAARDAQRAQLGAEAPMRADVEQDGTMGSPLFDAVDQPKFDMGDGRGARTLADIEAEIDAEFSAIDAIKGCLL